MDQAQRSAPLRWPDGDVVLAWRALHNRLEGYTMLPPDRYPLATRAAALLGALFPTGIDFVKAAGEGRPGELRRRHQRLRDEAMRAELVAVAGGDFVDELDRVMSIDRGRPSLSLSRPEAPLPAPLSGSLASLQRTLAAYLLQLVAMHDEGNAQARMAVRVAFGPVTQMGVSLAGAAERTPRRAMLASVAAPGN